MHGNTSVVVDPCEKKRKEIRNRGGKLKGIQL